MRRTSDRHEVISPVGIYRIKVKRVSEKNVRLLVHGKGGEGGVNGDALWASAICMNHVDRTIHELNCARHQGVGKIEREIQDEE